MGFYIEELPTELNGITMKEAVYWADIYLQDNPCDRMWDAIRALRDFYETVTSEAVEVADRKTEPQRNGYDKGLQLFADILFDKEKSEQFLKECKSVGIDPQEREDE